MKRLLRFVLLLIVAGIVLPPLWFAAFPGEPAPELPPAGTRVVLPDGTVLNVVEAGKGPPVVMVHGLPGSAYDWRETTAALARMNRRAIAYDRAGYGRSGARISGTFSVESNAAELLALLDVMDLEDVTVVGWSYGGAIAMTAAMAHPERIRRIVLVGTGGPDSADAEIPEPSLAMRIFYSDPVLRWRVAIPPMSVALMKVLSGVAFSDQEQPRWWLQGLRANFNRWETLITFREEMMGMTPESTADFAPQKIAVPTLILHGDDDRMAPVGIARYLATVIPDVRSVEYPGGSHALPVTHAEQVAEQIVEFSN